MRYLRQWDVWLPERSLGIPWSQQTAAQDNVLQPLAWIDLWPGVWNTTEQQFKIVSKVEHLFTFIIKRCNRYFWTGLWFCQQDTSCILFIHSAVLIMSHLFTFPGSSWWTGIWKTFYLVDSLLPWKAARNFNPQRELVKTTKAAFADRCCVLCEDEWKKEASWQKHHKLAWFVHGPR